MPFIGQTPATGAYQLLDSITTSAANTFALTLSGSPYYPETAQNLVVSLNGVTQAPISAYTVNDSNIVFASDLTASDVIDYILVLGDVLSIGAPSDNTVSTSKLQNGAVTNVKIDTMAASKLTGALPAIDGSALTGIESLPASIYSSANAASNTIIIENDSDVTFGANLNVQHIIPQANITYDLGTNDLRFRDIYLSGSTIKLGDHSITANGTHIAMAGMAFGATASANNLTVQNDLTVSGDFVVNGNTTTIAASELKVEDSLIQLASNNEVSDTVDIGFVGHYYNGSSQLHTGFFRDATDGQYYLFTGYDDASFDTDTPPATIDRTANTFALADLTIGNLQVGLNNTGNNYITIGRGGVFNSGIQWSRGGTIDSKIYVDEAENLIISCDEANLGSENIIFQNGNATERMRIDSSGNVGIGTDSTVDGLLHLKSTGPIEVILEADSDNAIEEDNPRIIFKQDGGSVISRVGYRNATNDFEIINEFQESLYLGANNSLVVYVEPSGDVGIGASPESVGTGYTTLDIVGNGSTTGGAVRMQTSGSETDGTIFTNSNGLGLATYSNHSINFYTNSYFSSAALEIESNRNVKAAGIFKANSYGTNHVLYLSDASPWVKIYERHYYSTSTFGYNTHNILVTCGGATNGHGGSARLHIVNKQQGTSDNFDIQYVESVGADPIQVRYYYDSAGGQDSGGILTVWAKPPLIYNSISVFSDNLLYNDDLFAGKTMVVSTGSTTNPANSIDLPPALRIRTNGNVGLGESYPDAKLFIKDGGNGIRFGSGTHSDTSNVPTTEFIMFNRTSSVADLAAIGTEGSGAGRLAFFSREGIKIYTGGSIGWEETSLALTIDNVGNIVYPPSGSDTGLYFGGETTGSSYGYIRNPAGTDGQIEIGSDASVTFTETDGDVVRATFDLNSGIFTFVGDIRPATNNAHNLGTGSLRWANIYVNDLHLSNETKEGGNDVDGTTGDWTIQEGEENLYIVNNKSGKKYKFKLEEV